MQAAYKHATKVTSQIYFCASPIRLDAYNRCQFGCVYCFSRQRAINTSDQGVRRASTNAFSARMKRVSEGKINSVLDEFLQQRVPIQLGGMQDPFSNWEARYETTLDLLKTLKSYNYPTMISTKGRLFCDDPYISILSSGNFFVRISAAGISEKYREKIDYRCDSFSKTLTKIEKLAKFGIPTSLRIQPIIPGFEEDAVRMAQKAYSAGASHVSFEFLKLPMERRSEIGKEISDVIGWDLEGHMASKGMKRLGPDYTLDVGHKLKFLIYAKRQLAKIKIGAGDTELIHLSDGGGCCNGSGLFLENANQFSANLTGILSGRDEIEEVRFSSLNTHWAPSGNVHQYLITDSRTRDMSGNFSDWLSLIAHRWNGKKGPYSPMLFAGVSETEKIDSDGFKIYKYTSPIL